MNCPLVKLVGMGWTSPVIRTFVQAALTVVVAAGAGFVDVEVWRAAAMAGVAAAVAFLQSTARG